MTNAPVRPARMLAVADVADRLHVSSKTIRRWITRKDLRVHWLGGQIRVTEEALQDFLRKRQV